MSSSHFGLSDETIDKINSVFTLYPDIQKVILYGSRATGKYKAGSDIDLTLFSDNLNISTLHEIQTKLDDLSLPYQIDLSHYESLTNPEFIDHIDRVGIPFSTN